MFSLLQQDTISCQYFPVADTVCRMVSMMREVAELFDSVPELEELAAFSPYLDLIIKGILKQEKGQLSWEVAYTGETWAMLGCKTNSFMRE